MTGALAVEVTGQSFGQPQRLHGALRIGEAGRQAVAVTPVSELIVADALGGVPQELLAGAGWDFNRLAGNALADSTRRVAAPLQPVLDAAGVGAGVGVRIALFDAPAAPSLLDASARGAAALPRALAWLDVEPTVGGKGVRHVAMPVETWVRFLAAGGDDGEALSRPDVTAVARVDTALLQLAAIDRELSALGASLAKALPEAAVLDGFVSPNFCHGGLNRDQFVARVLRRDDAATDGAFNPAGATFSAVRLLAVDRAAPPQVRFALRPRSPFALQSLAMAFEQQAGRWVWRGAGLVPQAQLGWGRALGPPPMAADAVRARPGVACGRVHAASLVESCQADAAAKGLTVPGRVDYGDPADARSGLLGLFRRTAADAPERRAGYAKNSRLLAAPSALVQRFLALAVDARQSDPRVQTMVITAPARDGATAGALSWTLYRPAGRPGRCAALAALDVRSRRPAGLACGGARCCEGTALAKAPPEVCRDAWSGVQRGSRWGLRSFEACGAMLQQPP
ncbi:MAG: hypothetical protein LH480_14165 [Rubrivivax sp.]|nr:hypothetical protein [Rubrivivax sp.]